MMNKDIEKSIDTDTTEWNIETFKKILRCTQLELKKIVQDCLELKEYKPIIGDGFVYAKGDIPILLVAHLDTVHKETPKNIYYDSQQSIMWSPQGIGGDDRCGVYLVLKTLDHFKPHVLFTEDEEIGLVGAKKVVDTILPPEVKFIVELDRRGSDDCVFYDCDNKEFQKYIEKFGFKTALGSCSDIVTLSDEWEIASVNLSSGYHNEHTLSETINFKEVQNTFKRLEEILKDDVNNKTYFDYNKKEYKYYYHSDSKYKSKDTSTEKKEIKEYSYWDGYGYIGDDDKYHYWDEEDDDKLN